MFVPMMLTLSLLLAVVAVWVRYECVAQKFVTPNICMQVALVI
jgi:hypothetical protein